MRAITPERFKALYELAKQRASVRSVGLAAREEVFHDGYTCAMYDVAAIPTLRSEDDFSFSRVCGILALIEAKKGRYYQASWQRRGLDSAYENIRRKFDRLEVLVAALKAGEGTGSQSENILETLGDAAVYAIKTIVLLSEADPNELQKWLEEVRQI